MSHQVDRSVFSDVVCRAIDAAASQANTMRTVDTRDVLMALMNADMIGQWDRIWLEFATPEAIGWAPVADPRPDPAAEWGGAQLTATCSAALTTAVRLAEQYEAESVSVGMVALGLVADPTTAAAMALTAGQRDRHASLLAAIQDAIIGMDLGPLRLAPDNEKAPSRRLSRRRLLDPDIDTTAAVTGQLSDLSSRSGFDVLVAAMSNLDNAELELRYRRLLLDTDALESVRPLVAHLPGPSAEDVIARARDRFDTKSAHEPDARQLVVAATHPPGEQVREALRLLGVSAVTVAFEAADVDARCRPNDDPVDNHSAWTITNVLTAVATSFFIARHAWATEQWWTLIFILLLWSERPLFTLMLAGVLWWATGSAAAIGAVVIAAIYLMVLRSVRKTALFRTGMALTVRQWRTHVRLRRAFEARSVTQVVRWKRMRRLPEDIVIRGAS